MLLVAYFLETLRKQRNTMNNVQMIFGAPGCGKTTHLIHILENLLKENTPDRIAFVSFTKKGSYEGRNRAMSVFNFKEADFPFFRTIHSIAFRELGMSRYDMMSKKNYKEFSTAMGMSFVGYYTEDFINNDDKYLFYESLVKNNPKAAECFSQDLDFRLVNRVNKNFSRYKEFAGVKDFDDLILDFIKEGKALPVDVAIIDEAQDLTSLQWKFCEVAFKECRRVYIAGDDDQALYEWSGADVDYFLGLTASSSVTVLDRSYRLRRNMLNYSKTLSSVIKNRVDKVFEPVDEGGKISYHESLSEIAINSEESYYLLSRNNYFLTKYKTHLMKLGVPFLYKGKSSVDSVLSKAIVRYERCRKEGDIVAMEKDLVLKELLHKDRNLSRPWYEVFNLPIEELNYYRDLFKNKVDPDNLKITVSTVHGVKGGEADNVVMLMDITKNTNSNLQKNIDSELRCLYVGVTRAKKNLHIVHSKSKFGYEDLIKI